MTIKKYRTIAEVYPYLSLEAMVEMDNGDVIYSNITVNSKGEKETFFEDAAWTYICPLTEIDWENVEDYYVDVPIKELDKIYAELLEFWNSYLIFDNNYEWKEYKKC